MVSSLTLTHVCMAHTLCITHDQFGGEGNEPPSGDYEIKNLLHTLHTYFVINFEHHIEFTKLFDVMHMKRPNIIHNVNFRWLSMVPPWLGTSDVQMMGIGAQNLWWPASLTWQPPIALAYFCHCWKFFFFLVIFCSIDLYLYVITLMPWKCVMESSILYTHTRLLAFTKMPSLS